MVSATRAHFGEWGHSSFQQIPQKRYGMSFLRGQGGGKSPCRQAVRYPRRAYAVPAERSFFHSVIQSRTVRHATGTTTPATRLAAVSMLGAWAM